MNAPVRSDQNLGEAGNRGDGVRSDCWVGVNIGREAELRLRSRVEALYGESIRAQVKEVIDSLGTGPLAIEIDDGGALPWVIAARIEAAVKAADPGLKTSWLPEKTTPRRVPVVDRLRRSRLYLPGNTPKFMLNAGRHCPDGIILDLEDSVAPSRKSEARLLVRNALRCHDFGSAEVMVRINQLPMGLEDLDVILPENPEVILIPKVENPDQVREVDEYCTEVLAGSDTPPPLLMPIIESCRGAWFALDIAEASSSVAALTIGLEDYTADLGVERTLEGKESFWARAQLVNAACAAGIQPIDTVFSDVDDHEELRASVLEAKRLGFVGKGCIHPRQIQVIHDAFAPSQREIEKAIRIVTAFEDAESRGDGVVALGSKMIDPPVVLRALNTVNQAVTLGLLTREWRSREEEKREIGDA